MAPQNANESQHNDDPENSDKSGTSKKKSKKKSESTTDVYATAARTIARCLNLWCEPSKMFNNMRLLQDEEMSKRGELDEDPLARELRAKSLSKISPESREFTTRSYYKLLQMVPSLKAILDDKTRHKELTDICNKLGAEIKNTRSSDATRLKPFISRYCWPNPDDPTSLLPAIIVTKTKAELGLNHPVLARWLCPVDQLAEYDKDPEQARKDLASGKIVMTAEDFPALVFSGAMPGQHYDPDSDDILAGLFRSYFLVRIARHIFLGPTYAIEAPNRKNRSCNAILNDVTTIEPEHIAYVCVQARFAISAKEMWNEEDGDLNYADMYRAIIRFIKDADDLEWKTNLLGFWNKEIFGNENGRGGSEKKTTGTSAPRMSTMEKLQARMKAGLAPPPEAPIDPSLLAEPSNAAPPNTLAPPAFVGDPPVPSASAMDSGPSACTTDSRVLPVSTVDSRVPPASDINSHVLPAISTVDSRVPPASAINSRVVDSRVPPASAMDPSFPSSSSAESPRRRAAMTHQEGIPGSSGVTSGAISTANPFPVTPHQRVPASPPVVSPLTDAEAPLTPVTNHKSMKKSVKGKVKRPAPPDEGEEGAVVGSHAGRKTRRRK